MRWMSPEHLARSSARRPWLVVAVWIALVVVGGLAASRIGDGLTQEFTLLNNPESQQADDLLEDRLRGPEQAREFVIVQSPDRTVDDPAFRAFVEGLVTEIRALDDVTAAATFYETNDPELVSDDRNETLIRVQLDSDESEAAEHVGDLVELTEERTSDEFTVLTAGSGSINRTSNELSESDAQRGEMIGIPVALIILLIVFGAAVAAGIPLVLAIVSIVVAVGTSAIIGQAFELNFLVLNIITMIGLAVGIDYSLFIVQRFREERQRGRAKIDAIARAGATSSRAVLFSGGTVIVALLGMFLVPSNVYRSLAVGAIAVAAAAVLAALTLLPAVLSLLGDRVNALRLPFAGRHAPGEAGGAWARVANAVMRRPLASIAVTVTLLVAAAIPYFTIEPGLAGVTTLPEDEPVREAFEILDTEFSGGLIAPAEIVIDARDVNDPAVQRGIDELRAALAGDPAFGETSVKTNDAGDLALVSALLNGDPASDESHEAIRRLRDDYVPAAFDGVDANVLVTGRTAAEEDVVQTIGAYTPYVFAFVLGLSFLLLLVVFRSIVVPAKAIVMNLLSVGATYGLLVLVFQHGVGNEIFGFQQSDTIETWLPLFLFSILFGLSMDYHVFLLSRIRERFDETGDNRGSVAYGVRSTAGLITGAALIMVAVFSGFAMGDLGPLEQTGFGLAVAVILDATIIRVVLVPASMALLGDWNWYLPSWLRWLPDLRIEGAPEVRERARQVPQAASAGGD